VPKEGAEQVSQALAETFAEQPEGRTLLIDLAGTISRAKNARYGLTDVLLDQANFDEVFDSEDNLTVIGAGSQPGGHSIIWSGAGLAELMERIRGRYRYTVFNVAPVLTSHDALKIARHVDGVVLTIKSDATRREVVTRARDLFGERSNKIVGAVMTQRTQAIPSAVYRRI
jgi:Mrp family chromosome partitioning ATPase